MNAGLIAEVITRPAGLIAEVITRPVGLIAEVITRPAGLIADVITRLFVPKCRKKALPEPRRENALKWKLT